MGCKIRIILFYDPLFYSPPNFLFFEQKSQGEKIEETKEGRGIIGGDTRVLAAWAQKHSGMTYYLKIAKKPKQKFCKNFALAVPIIIAWQSKLK